jgi:hypothetical protein
MFVVRGIYILPFKIHFKKIGVDGFSFALFGTKVADSK